MRTLLFTGPGGSGSTTLAAAAALRAAHSGRRTLLLCRERPRVAGLDAVAGLTVEVVDAQAAVEEGWNAAAAGLADLVPQVALPPASSVVPLPGVVDLAVLASLARAEADVVVLDAGPLSSATALLALPGALRWWLDQLLPPQMRVLAAVRTAGVRTGTVRRGPVDVALAGVPALERLLDRIALTDPATTEVILVAAPRPSAVAALRTATTTLALHGHLPRTVLVRVPPDDGPGDWWAQRRAERRVALAALGSVAPVHRVPEQATEPENVPALLRLLPETALRPAETAGPGTDAVPERVGGGWRLCMPLPFAERAAVQATRWGDDLVISVGGARRTLRLDALLRRCAVTGGRLAGAGSAAARLEVTFAPDPRLWPADLLPAEETAS